MCVFIYFLLCSADFVLQNQHVILKMTVLTWLGKFLKNNNKKKPQHVTVTSRQGRREYLWFAL